MNLNNEIKKAGTSAMDMSMNNVTSTAKNLGSKALDAAKEVGKSAMELNANDVVDATKSASKSLFGKIGGVMDKFKSESEPKPVAIEVPSPVEEAISWAKDNPQLVLNLKAAIAKQVQEALCEEL